MKKLSIICAVLMTTLAFAQDTDKERQKKLTVEKATDYVYEGNELVDADNYISAEMEYRKAISKAPSVVAGSYNLGNSYYEKENYEEALYRLKLAADNSNSKSEKHKIFHNIGNILMKKELCEMAVESFKNALRNDPTDDETRYNLALAKECAEQQKKEEEKDKDKEEEKKDEDKEDEKKDQEKEEDEKKEDPKDEGDQDKKEGDDQKDDEGKPKDDKDQGKEEKKDEKKEKGKPKPKPGQLSPQQIKNLLEAMNNQEQKVQQKINADKQKGVKVKPEKDW